MKHIKQYKLYEFGTSSEADLANRFYKACVAGDNEAVEVAKELLENPNLNHKYEGALMIACEHGRLDALKVLLKDGRIDPSFRHNALMQIASGRGYIDIVKLLLADPRVDASDKNNDAIRYASLLGYDAVVRLLLDDERVFNKIGNIHNIDNYQLIKYALADKLDLDENELDIVLKLMRK